MKFLSLIPVFSSFLGLVYAECNITGANPAQPPGLSDLRTPTPFTWTLTAIASGCATAPQTYTDDFTWFVQGTPFSADSIVTVTYSGDGFYTLFFTFPGMTVTSLTRGEVITLIDQFGGTDEYSTVPIRVISSYTVPYNALVASSTPSPTPGTPSSTQPPITSFTSSGTISTSPPPSNGSKTPIGGIVAGAVVGGVVVILIIALTFYFIAKGRRPANHGRSQPSPEVYPQSPVGKESYPEYEMHPPVEGTPLRYPDSGNVRGDY